MSVVSRSMMIVVCLSLFGAACTNTIRTAPPVQSNLPLEKLITDPFVNAFAHVIAVREGQTQGGNLRAQVDVYNRLPLRRTFNYQFVWLDSSGMVIRSATASATMVQVIEAKGTITLNAIAPTTQATDFRLELSGEN